MNTELKKRLEESIDILKNGRAVKIDVFVLDMSRKKQNLKELDRLMVNGYVYNDIPKTIIKDELQKVKDNFILIMNESEIFMEFATKVGIDYYLLLDYQTGGSVICAEINGQYKETPRSA